MSVNLSHMAPRDAERLQELLADSVTVGLSDGESQELGAFPRELVEAEEAAFQLVAAALELAFMTQQDVAPMPADVGRRLSAAGDAWEARMTGVVARVGPAQVGSIGPRLAWLAAAAALLLAAVAWWPKAEPSASALVAALKARGASVAAWGAWENPAMSGVAGEVVWDEESQSGYMTFRGLPVNNPSKEQYQLWIVDGRGLGFRISGGVFDVNSGEVVVPIDAALRVQGAALFAVTIEEPGGVIESDMTRKAVIASLATRPSKG